MTREGTVERMTAAVGKAWDEQFGDSSTLEIVEVDRIEASPGGKQQNFTSDFFPETYDD